MITAQTVLNSLVFWSAWIIIPVIMEIIPALGCVFLSEITRVLFFGAAGILCAYELSRNLEKL